MTQKTNQNPWTMDVRVRERNLRAGVLTEKDLEKQLAALPDLADQAEPFATAQPALAQPPAAVAAVSAVDEDFGDDEDDDMDDADEADAAAPAAADVGSGSAEGGSGSDGGGEGGGGEGEPT